MTQRILFITQTHNIWGGMEQWLHNFTLWLQENTGFDVRVALPRGRKFNDPDAFLLAHPHMRPIVLDVRVGSPTIRVRRIREAIERFDAGLIVPIATGDVFEAVEQAKRRGSQVRLLQPIRALVPELFANVLDFWPVIDGVVSISALFDSFFRKHLSGEAERLHYVRHGARLPFVEHDRRGADDAASPLRVSFVGRIEPEMKRIFDLVPLVERLERDSANVEVHLFGRGPAEDELRSRLSAAALPVVFHGYKTLDDLYREAYPHTDVILLLSGVGEGTPNAVVEAMQHGCVPVITRYPGQRGERFAIHERNGFTFRTGDTDAAAEYILKLANDRRLLGEMSARAKEDVANDTAARMHRDWVAIIEKTLAMPQKLPRNPLARKPPAGRLDRVLSPAVADTVRQITHRYFPHPDGWSEWPGSVAADRERVVAIATELDRLDRYTDGE